MAPATLEAEEVALEDSMVAALAMEDAVAAALDSEDVAAALGAEGIGAAAAARVIRNQLLQCWKQGQQH